MATISIRETSTALVKFQLIEDNAPIDLSAVNKVVLVLVPQDGSGTLIDYNTTDNPTVLSVASAARGIVQYAPQTGDLTVANSPYRVFFWVYTSATAFYAVPDKTDEELIIEVSNDYA
jgi:hypothetical protein